MRTVLLISIFVLFASAAVYDIYPNTPNFATVFRNYQLVGGDVVNFHAASNGGSATYDMTGVGGFTFNWNGQPNNPIRVRAFPGDKITITNTNSAQNILKLSGSYWEFTGFEIVGNAAATGAQAIQMIPPTNHIVLSNLNIHDLYENAITANIAGGDYNNITIRGCEIWKTAGTGECIYFGCQGNTSPAKCAVHDSLIENCYCHDTCLGGGNTQCSGGSLGSGYQIKQGSYRNIIRNSACHNTFSPCILLYDDFNMGANLVEGNVILNTRGDSGIQVSAGAVFRNNIVIGSNQAGIYVTSNANNLLVGFSNRNLVIESNTFALNGKYGVWFQATPSTTVIRNNLLLGNTQGDFSPTNQAGVTYQNNAYNTGSLPSGVVSGTGAFLVGATSTQVVNAAAFNVYPVSTSSLIKAGVKSDLGYDFNGFKRNSCAPTVGAYEFSTASNPGWAVRAAFKVTAGTVAPCSLTKPCPAVCVPPTTAAPTTAAPTTVKPTTVKPTTAAPTTRQPIRCVTKDDIINAINKVQAGDVILVEPGTYNFAEAKVNILNRPAATLRAASKNSVFFNFVNTANPSAVVEGFVIDNSSGWTFENIVIEGKCSNIAKCEHAFRVINSSNNLVFRNLNLINFNYQIRQNNAPNPSNFALVSGCTFFDRVIRPSTTYKINLSGSSGWNIRGNYFYQFSSNGMSAAISASTTTSLIIDSNLILASKVGTSLGVYLRDSTGVFPIVNNIIARTKDVGIYIERAKDANIYNNILYDSAGIDVRFAPSNAVIRNNIYNGVFRNRDSGTSTVGKNLQVIDLNKLNTYFVNPSGNDFRLSAAGKAAAKGLGDNLSDLTKDYCQNNRAAPFDFGPFDLKSPDCASNLPIFVADPNRRVLSSSSSSSTSNSSNKTSSGDIALYVIIGVCALVAVVVVVVAVVLISRRRQNNTNNNLKEPLLDQN